MKQNKPQLTISLLASNRPDTLRRCLDSLHSIMEAIPCELILIDTSKDLQIHRMLLEYTDQVYEFDWCQDFSKARNEGLRRANGEWFMFLDDDEWFVETKALIEFFQSGEYKRYGYANYQVRNFLDAKYTNYSDCWVTRLTCIEKDTCFYSKIHEYIEPLNGERKDLYTMVYHSGYIYHTPEEERAHFERNSSLLLKMIKEEPYNIRWQTHLVQEYCNMNEWETLENFCRKCLKDALRLESAYESVHIGTFYTGLVYSLINLKKYNESIQICKQVLADKRSAEVLRAMMYLKLGESYFRLGEWDQALEQTAKYLDMLQTIDQKNERILEQKFALLVGSVFENNCQKTAYSVLICSQLEKGDVKTLVEHYDKLGWNQPIIFKMEDVEWHLAKAMLTLPYNPIFVCVVIDVFRKRQLRELFCQAILEMDAPSENAFQMVLYAFIQSIQGIVKGPQLGDLLGYQNILQQYVQAACQWYDFVQEQNMADYYTEEGPEYLQVAVKINDYIQLESQDRVQALGKLKEAVEIFPELAIGIGEFLYSYADLDRQRAEQQKKEMEALRIQVIGQVKAMLENGQVQTASQIITQLKQMFPEDLEVMQLALEVRLRMIE